MMNALPIVVALIVMTILIRLASTRRAGWLLLNGAEVLAAVAGLLIAWRLRSRIALFLLAAFATYSVAMFVVHNGIGAQAAQGFGAQVAVLAAATIGVIVGALLMARTRVTTEES